MNSLMSPADTLALFQTNKGERIAFVQTIIDNIHDGKINPLVAHLQVKCMEDLLDLIKENTIYRADVLEEAGKMGGKSFEFNNATFKFMEAAVKYDYTQCGDDVILNLLEEEKILKEKIKARQKLLQAMPEKGMADPETGNLCYPPSRKSTTTIAVTLK